MPAPLSPDLRQRICQAYDQQEGSMVVLAKRFCVGERTVERLLTRRRITGSILPGKPTGRKRKLTEEDRQKLRQAVEATPDATLQELLEAVGVSGSLTLIDNELKRMKITRKKSH